MEGIYKIYKYIRMCVYIYKDIKSENKYIYNMLMVFVVVNSVSEMEWRIQTKVHAKMAVVRLKNIAVFSMKYPCILCIWI